MDRNVLVAISVALLLMTGGARAIAAPGQSSETTTSVTAVVNASVQYSVVDAAHVDVLANTAWRLTAETAKGIVVVSGPRTGDVPVRVHIPAGTIKYSVTCDR
jgi:hypothetical protein